MARPLEGLPLAHAAVAFDQAVARRHGELDRLSKGFHRGIELLMTPGRVNEILVHSARPDLVITDPVQVRRIHSLEDVEHLNNFIPRMRSFGVPINEEYSNSWDPDLKLLRTLGWRKFTEAERTQAFLIGARGDRQESSAFAEANGIDSTFALDLFDNSLIKHQAFMRMWIVMPEFIDDLMAACLQRPNGKDFKKIEEELFVAYTLMSGLVDRNDRDVLCANGTVQDGVFCL